MTNPKLHPVERADALEGTLRSWLQNPVKILKPYIRPGMTMLDLGCGPGFFTVAMAELLNGSGKVIAADIQKGMLDRVKQKIVGTPYEPLIQIHQCQESKLNLNEEVDFVFAFYALHEMSHLNKMINEIKSALHPGGSVFIAEQKFHVSKAFFDKIVSEMKMHGFKVIKHPRVFLSRSVIMTLRRVD